MGKRGRGGVPGLCKEALVQFQIVGGSVSDENPLGLSPGILLNSATPILEKKLPTKPGADLGGGCGGCAPPPPQDDLRFSNTTGILPKKKLSGLLVLK